jgi:CubicO group peptidase (beta-lactamase class C family)
MRLTTFTHLSALAFAAGASICPMLGPVFPAPKDLHSSIAFQDKLKDLRAKMEAAFASGNTMHGPVDPSDTYSIQVFSTSSEHLLVDYHRRGSAVLGNRTVDGDSVYRIASTSKLITVYLLLIQAGPSIFSDKVIKYLPELAGVVHWDDITVGSLAGYLADITSECEHSVPKE